MSRSERLLSFPDQFSGGAGYEQTRLQEKHWDAEESSRIPSLHRGPSLLGEREDRQLSGGILELLPLENKARRMKGSARVPCPPSAAGEQVLLLTFLSPVIHIQGSYICNAAIMPTLLYILFYFTSIAIFNIFHCHGTVLHKDVFTQIPFARWALVPSPHSPPCPSLPSPSH